MLIKGSDVCLTTAVKKVKSSLMVQVCLIQDLEHWMMWKSVQKTPNVKAIWKCAVDIQIGMAFPSQHL